MELGDIFEETENRVDMYMYSVADVIKLMDTFPSDTWEMYQPLEQRSNRVRFELKGRFYHIHLYSDSYESSIGYKKIENGKCRDSVGINRIKRHKGPLQVRGHNGSLKYWQPIETNEIEVFPPVCQNVLEEPKVVGRLTGRFHIMEFVLYCPLVKKFSIVPIISTEINVLEIDGKKIKVEGIETQVETSPQLELGLNKVLIECGRTYRVLFKGDFIPIPFDEDHEKRTTIKSIATYIGVEEKTVTALRGD